MDGTPCDCCDFLSASLSSSSSTEIRRLQDDDSSDSSSESCETAGVIQSGVCVCDESLSESESGSDEEKMELQMVFGANYEENIMEKKDGNQDEVYHLDVALSNFTMINFLLIFGVLLAANVVLFYCCYKKEKNVIKRDRVEDNSRLDVIA